MPDNNAVRIKTDPDPYEAFKIAQAYRVGNLIFVSGQAAIDMEGNLVGAGDFDAQAARILDDVTEAYHRNRDIHSA